MSDSTNKNQIQSTKIHKDEASHTQVTERGTWHPRGPSHETDHQHKNKNKTTSTQVLREKASMIQDLTTTSNPQPTSISTQPQTVRQIQQPMPTPTPISTRIPISTVQEKALSNSTAKESEPLRSVSDAPPIQLISPSKPSNNLNHGLYKDHFTFDVQKWCCAPWFEIAHVPQVFEPQNEEDATVSYTQIQPKSHIIRKWLETSLQFSIENSMQLQGKRMSIQGVVTLDTTYQPKTLSDPLVKASIRYNSSTAWWHWRYVSNNEHYWIYHVEEDMFQQYWWAIIAHPSSGYFQRPTCWILSRERTMNDVDLVKAKSIIATIGIPLRFMVRRKQNISSNLSKTTESTTSTPNYTTHTTKKEDHKQTQIQTKKESLKQ